jgi:hypothetical protein
MGVRGRLAGTITAKGGTQWREICRLEKDAHGTNYTGVIYTTANNIEQPVGAGFPVPNPRIAIRARIGSGNECGGSGIVHRYTLAGNPLPFSGHSCFVEALISPNEQVDLDANGNGLAPLPETVVALVTAIIALGASSDIQPTQWVIPEEPLQFAQQVTTTPCRLRQVQGFNSGADAAYLMFFDTNDGAALVNGAVPLFTIPVSGIPSASGSAPITFSNDFITSARVFQYGLYWAISSTPDTLTIDEVDLFRVDIELYAQVEALHIGGTGQPPLP